MNIITAGTREIVIPNFGPVVPARPIGGAAATTYTDKVLTYNPIAYWTLGDTSGTTAVDEVDSPAQDGEYFGPTLADATFPNGDDVPSFDGTNDRVDVHSATFAAAFDGDEGWISFWIKVPSSVWSDGATRYAFIFLADGSNFIPVEKASTNNLVATYRAGGVSRSVTKTNPNSADWMHLAITWSAAADEFIFYFDGAQVGSVATGLGTWAGTLSSSRTHLGVNVAPGTHPWLGNIAHFAVGGGAPLSAAAVADLADTS